MGEIRQPEPILAASPEERLDSWKEIAGYLKRDVRTVRRWEKSEGLPVHRHEHNRLSSVYAYPAELEAWLERRQPAASEKISGRKRPGWGRVASGVFLAAAVGLAFAWYFARGPGASQSAENRVMLVVLPFENLSGDAGQEYFSDGMTDEMISRLGRLNPEQLGVIGLATAMQYKGLSKGIQKTGDELQVDYVVEGGVLRSHDRVRMTARLVRVADQAQVWSESFERQADDVFAVQREVALSIARGIQLKLALPSGGEVAPLADQKAYEDFLQGRYFFKKFTVEGLRKSIEHFENVLKRQPDHVPSLAGLGSAYAVLGNTNVRPREAYSKAKEMTARALQLDPTLAEAHAQMGFCHVTYDFDWPAAEREFQKALQLNPNSVLARHGYAVFLVTQGRFDEGLAEIERARKLDPLSLIVNADIGWLLFHARRYQEAERTLKKTLELDPNFAPAHAFLGFVYGQMGRTEDAFREGLWFRRILGWDEESIQAANRLLKREGAEFVYRKMLKDLQRASVQKYVPAYWLATAHLQMGQKDEALRALEDALVERHWMMAFLKVDPRMDPLRGDERFQALLKRMGLSTTR